ncbi:PAB1 binding protein [Cryptotrichosporon argae]
MPGALATELILLILSYCDLKSRTRCARASRRLRKIVLPLLYHHVAIRPGALGSPLCPRASMFCTPAQRQRWLGRVCPLVRTLSLHCRAGEQLAVDTLPPLPNLETLRIVHDGAATASLLGAPILHGSSTPSRLVLKNMPLLYDSPSAYVPPRLSSITHLTTVHVPDTAAVGRDMKFEAFDCSAYGLLRAIPPSARRLTVILYTESPATQWRPQPRPHHSRGPARHSELDMTWVGRFCRVLAQGLAERAPDNRLAVNLVNFGALDRLSVNEDEWEPARVQQKVESFMRDVMLRCREKAGKGVDQLPDAAVRFLGLAEWLRDNAWDNVFDTEEVKAWL